MTHSAAASDEDALARARSLIAAAEEADGVPPVSDQAILAAAQHERRLLLFSDDRVDPDPAALGIVGQGEVDLVVHPEARGFGIGAEALATLLRQEDGELLAWAHGDRPAAEHLLEGAGFSPVRSLYRMALDPERLPKHATDPLRIDAPSGFALRAFDAGDPADAESWVAANAAAFASHPEQGRMTVADLELLEREPWFDPADLILLADLEAAADGHVLAGSTWVKTVRDPEHSERVSECELYAVGVRPEYAGRGLGKLLLQVTLARMAEHRPAEVSLYVDGENERAVRMYETAGFTVRSRSRQWRRPPLSAVDARMDA